MFFDYRTGRVERYLVNSEKDILNTPWTFKNNTFSFENKNYIINRTEEHKIPDFSEVYAPLLNDGNLSSAFYRDFLSELKRDYIFSLDIRKQSYSYNYTNMDVIRMITRPSIDFDADYQMGSGIIPHKDGELIQFSKNLKLKNFKWRESEIFFKTNFDLPFLIHVPKKFINTEKDTQKVKLRELEIKNNCQAIMDLKRSLQIKTVTSLSDLDYRIRVFNYNFPDLLKKNEIIKDHEYFAKPYKKF